MSQQNLNIKMRDPGFPISYNPKTSVSCPSKLPHVKDQVKPVKPWQADKPMKADKPVKVTGVHAHKDRVAPAKTTLAF